MCSWILCIFIWFLTLSWVFFSALHSCILSEEFELELAFWETDDEAEKSLFVQRVKNHSGLTTSSAMKYSVFEKSITRSAAFISNAILNIHPSTLALFDVAITGINIFIRDATYCRLCGDCVIVKSVQATLMYLSPQRETKSSRSSERWTMNSYPNQSAYRQPRSRSPPFCTR